MIKKLLFTGLLSVLVQLPNIASAGKAEHGIKFGYAANSDASIDGSHLNLYTPSDTSTWKIEQTEAQGGEVSDIYSIGYRYKSAINDGPVAIELGVAFTKAELDEQTINLVSQEGTFNISSDQPAANAEYLELYMGALYDFETGKSYTPYVGAGFAYVTGEANKTYYNLTDLLTGVDTYGKSGSSDLNGYAFIVKGGVEFNKFALELEYGNYELKIDKYRSLEITGANLGFDKLMLTAIYKLGQ